MFKNPKYNKNIFHRLVKHELWKYKYSKKKNTMFSKIHRSRYFISYIETFGHCNFKPQIKIFKKLKFQTEYFFISASSKSIETENSDSGTLTDNLSKSRFYNHIL